MGTISKPEQPVRRLFASSQLRYAVVYILISSVVLVFLNIYTPRTIRSLTFSAQHAAMTDKAQLIVSAFSTYESLDSQTVGEVIRSVNDLHTTRVLVTDPAGQVLYDSMEPGGAQNKLALLPELAEALTGKDVVHIQYVDGVLLSKAAMPIMAYNKLIGGAYLMERDLDQGRLISSLQTNILRLSLVLEAVVIVFSLLTAMFTSSRMRKIMNSVRQLRDGNYAVKLPVKGSGEIARLSAAFNDLSSRLEQSEEVRKQFVSNASHELKTPLASIKLLSDSILQNEMDPATTKEFVSDIGNEADRLTRLSAKLLELTRLDSSPQEQRELVHAEVVADRVLKMLLPLARKQDVRLRLEASPDCKLLGTEDDLYQILFNLVENGIKYNHPGGEVVLGVAHDEEEVLLVVEDTGSGIPDEAKAHIFERFYRVDKARSRKAGGAGLGLSIVHDMVARNDGAIEVTDRPGGGSRFTLRFAFFDMVEEEL